jgi:hypothetical protein
MVKHWTLILYLLLATTLVACGGGETGDADPVAIDEALRPPVAPTPLPDFSLQINQRDLQPDPTTNLPIEFRLVFARPIVTSTFTIDDITQNGTAAGVEWKIIGLGLLL